MNDSRIPTAVLAAGTGTNAQAVIDAAARGELPLDVRLVVSNDPNAGALDKARRSGIPVDAIPFDRQSESRGEYATRLAARLRDSGVRLVLLLGWMHVLAPEFLAAGFDGVLNLHPSYLPDDPSEDFVTLPNGTRTPCFRGPRALRDAIEAGVAVTGVTLIEITADVDRGPVLARTAFALQPGEDEASALARLHPVEHEVVKQGVLEWLAARVR